VRLKGAKVGFLFDGVSSQRMKIRAMLTNWQASPALRNAFITIPGKPGVVDFGSTAAEKILTVRCGIMPQHDFASLVRVLDGVAEWLHPAKGLKQLVLDDVPDRFFWARLSEAIDCERVLRSAGAFDLRFVCPDPHGYALSDEVFTISADGEHEVLRQKGNTDSEPVYIMKGIIPSDAESYIVIHTNDEELRVIGELTEEEMLVIDTGKLTAKVTDTQGETLRNGLPCLRELNFPMLRKGTNAITVDVAGDALFSELVIQAKSRWR
jgi:predicted phage tail component-like protein